MKKVSGSILSNDVTQGKKDTLARQLLSPLRYGKAVAFIVEDDRAPKKKRAERPMMFFTPITLYGKLSSKICIAYQTYGCEVVDTRERITPMVFMRMGVAARLARAISSELNSLFDKGA